MNTIEWKQTEIRDKIYLLSTYRYTKVTRHPITNYFYFTHFGDYCKTLLSYLEQSESLIDVGKLCLFSEENN